MRGFLKNLNWKTAVFTFLLLVNRKCDELEGLREGLEHIPLTEVSILYV